MARKVKVQDANGDLKVFDPDTAVCWGTEIDTGAKVEHQLYRLDDGSWLLLLERISFEPDMFGEWQWYRTWHATYKTLTDQEAVHWLLWRDFEVPPDLSALVDERDLAKCVMRANQQARLFAEAPAVRTDQPRPADPATSPSPIVPEAGATPAEQPTACRAPRPSREELNVKARTYLRKHRAREKTKDPVSVRELAKVIGCSEGTVVKLPAWRALMERRQKRATPKALRAVQLSDKVLAATGEQDEELQRLIAEQEADREPSPLSDSPTRVREHKRL
jgi:hypothetical protein